MLLGIHTDMRAEHSSDQEADAPGADAFRMQRRFDRMGRLVGDRNMEFLAGSHVMVLGLGGVGSWAAEALARSGIGTITLVDFDDVCITNFNRQLHALEGAVGAPKADVMADRLRKINPAATIRVQPLFYNTEHHARIFETRPDYVVDAIDAVTCKCRLLTYCRAEGIPVVCATGSGGRLDPGRVEVADLALTDVDPLARTLRKLLRRDFGFPAEGLFGIPAVFSKELPTTPHALAYDGPEGVCCVCPRGSGPYMKCDERNLIMGTAAFVTGAFGLQCAAVVVRGLMERRAEPAGP
jgi:tRNA threonylcarbamoyladenosine dehydratase